jgi:hypothetical protein
MKTEMKMWGVMDKEKRRNNVVVQRLRKNEHV